MPIAKTILNQSEPPSFDGTRICRRNPSTIAAVPSVFKAFAINLICSPLIFKFVLNNIAMVMNFQIVRYARPL